MRDAPVKGKGKAEETRKEASSKKHDLPSPRKSRSSKKAKADDRGLSFTDLATNFNEAESQWISSTKIDQLMDLLTSFRVYAFLLFFFFIFLDIDLLVTMRLI